jgi:GET complex subunit GET2
MNANIISPLALARGSPSPSTQPFPVPAPLELQEQHRSSSTSPSPPTTDSGERLPEDQLVQQESLRAFLRQYVPETKEEEQEARQQEPDLDPTMRVINAMLSGLAPVGESAGSGTEAEPQRPKELSPSGLLTSLGLPLFLSKLLLRTGKPLTAEEKRRVWMWKLLHVLFAFVLGIYMVLLLGSSVLTYGSHPPPPPTMQNPFIMFLTGELLLAGTRLLMKGHEGELNKPSTWLSLLQDLVRDGSTAVFVLGIGSWWYEG